MLDKVAKLWNEKRWLFWVLCIITVPLIIIKYYLEYNVAKAEEELREARDRDDRLRAEQDRANNEAERHKSEADRLEDEINKTDHAEDDWHLKD